MEKRPTAMTGDRGYWPPSINPSHSFPTPIKTNPKLHIAPPSQPVPPPPSRDNKDGRQSGMLGGKRGFGSIEPKRTANSPVSNKSSDTPGSIVPKNPHGREASV